MVCRPAGSERRASIVGEASGVREALPGCFASTTSIASRSRRFVVITPARFRGAIIGRIALDAFGDIYATSSRGVVRIDGASTRGASAAISALYTTSDGLAGTEVGTVYADHGGRLWFATTQALAYFDPRRRRHAAAPAVRIALFRDFRPPEATASGLTPHEIRLLRLFVEGHNYKTAAAELGVTVHTVSFHLRSIYEKLQVHSKSEAVAQALRRRLV